MNLKHSSRSLLGRWGIREVVFPWWLFARWLTATVCGLTWVLGAGVPVPSNTVSGNQRALERIQVDPRGRTFVTARSGERFVAWGFNYDHDAAGRLIEDYWENEWETVVEDFREMKALGANLVRVHLQLGRFMTSEERPDEQALERLARLLELSEQTGLYLDLTGLGCYHKQDVPPWYDGLGEAERWAVQARFWEAVAGVGKSRAAVFCYDLMNEPIVPGGDKVETDWLAAEFGGKHFVQRIALNAGGRTQREIAKVWVKHLARAIRKQDPAAMITVGVIPWAHTFPGAKPLFYAPDVAGPLDFVSVHFYPRSGEVDKAVAALAVYDLGKPLVIEEWFPLQCSLEEFNQFFQGSRERAEGWVGFYWGKQPDEYAEDTSIAAALTRAWLEFFEDSSRSVLR